MFQSRRQFLKIAAAATLTACSEPKGLRMSETESSPFLINGNMVVPPNFTEPLDAATKALVRKTGLSAFKMSLGGSAGNYEETKEHIVWADQIFSANPDVFTKIRSYDNLVQARNNGLTGIIYSFEAATMLEDEPARVAEFADLGVLIMQPGYNNSNAFGAGVMSTEPPLGLSELGSEFVSAAERAYVLVDLSHAHEITAKDVINLATRPVAMTHTGCDAINPHQRNKSDEILRSVADTGGVIGIYEMSYLTPDLEQQSLEAFLAHINHAVNICGEDHVGIGSDTPILGFDTGPESMKMWNEINAYRKQTGVAAPGEGPPPYVTGLNGPHKMHSLRDELIKSGMTSNTADKILGDNFARLFKDLWA